MVGFVNSSISGELIPTGGGITLAIVSSGATITLGRSSTGSGVAGNPYTTIYSGPPTPVYIDVGDGLPTPLVSGTTYAYSLTDDTGTTYSTGFTPVPFLNIESPDIEQVVFRLFQAGISNIMPGTIASRVPPSQVMQAMPLQGTPALPLIVTNFSHYRQEEVPIGQAVEDPNNDGSWCIYNFVEITIFTSVLASNIGDRNFYARVVPAVMLAVIKSALAPIGYDISHKFMVANGQVADDPKGLGAGFYYSDCTVMIKGTMTITVTPPGLGTIDRIEFTAEVGGGATVDVVVPPDP